MFRGRPFAERDRPVLEAIYREGRAAAEWLPIAARGLAHFSQDTDGEAMLVAVAGDDDPVGFLSVWEPDRFIHHLYVSRAARRKGVGSALLGALVLPKPWRLKCLRANGEAAAFYRARGWVEVSSGTGEDGDFAVLERARAPTSRSTGR